MPKERWPVEAEARAEIRLQWEEPWGDRRQELVLIGQQMDRSALTAMLDRCLLTDAEMSLGAEQWTQFKDPFSAWQTAGEDSTRQEHLLEHAEA